MIRVLRELKQKEFTNILFELPRGLSVNKFFQMTKDIGLAGEGVHFVLISLDFQGESLPNGLRELTPSASQKMPENNQESRVPVQTPFPTNHGKRVTKSY